MVAYSFKRQMVDPILAGLDDEHRGVTPKRHTIRADRKRRHANPGERMQLYCEQRSKSCFKIGDAICTDVKPITIDFAKRWIRIRGRPLIVKKVDRDAFARADGFADWLAFRAFWPRLQRFDGWIIFWESIEAVGANDERFAA